MSWSQFLNQIHITTRWFSESSYNWFELHDHHTDTWQVSVNWLIECDDTHSKKSKLSKFSFFNLLSTSRVLTDLIRTSSHLETFYESPSLSAFDYLTQ